MRIHLHRLALGAVLGLGAGAAQATTVTVSSVVAEWTNTLPNGVAVTIPTLDAEDAEIRWGTPATVPPPAERRSGYRYETCFVCGSTIDLETEFTLGNFIHYNFPITGDTITQTDLDLDITVTFFDDLNNPILTDVISNTYRFEHDETPNIGAGCCNDIVDVALNPEVVDVVNLDGVLYTIDVIGFQVGGQTFAQFSTIEGQENLADLQMIVTADFERIPLPPALPLLAAAMLGLGYVARKRGPTQA